MVDGIGPLARGTGTDPEISVVIPCKGHADVLGDCLEAVAHQETIASYEVIVVDSADDDRVADVVDLAGEKARLVRSARDLSPAGARNLGVRHARGSKLAFTDADCLPASDWLEAARRGLGSGARLVGGPVLDANPRRPVAVCDNLLQFCHFSARRPSGTAEHFPSCNISLRRADFAALGGFHDTSCRAGEDVFLSSAACSRWPNGLQFVPEMRVAHRGRSRFRDYLRHQYVLAYARGSLNLHLKPIHRRLGRHVVFVPAVAFKRWSYLAEGIVRWRRLAMSRFAVLTPVIVPGLVASAVGFRRGLLDASSGQ